MVTQIVAIDIGGTHARFCLAHIGDDGSIELDEPVTLPTEAYEGVESALAEFAKRSVGPLPENLSFAVAGRADGDVIRFTNNSWIIDRAALTEKFRLARIAIVNDFEAVAHCIARADDTQFVHLTGPDRPLASTGTLSVLGPGTGLGVAHLHRRSPQSYRVTATEGGHVDFAPVDAIDDAILAHLRTKHARVSAERVVAGPAIADIYKVLCTRKGVPVDETHDVTIWTRGLKREDALAAAAVERFCLSLGSVAGDVALAQGGFGGVVIAGGVGSRLRDRLPQSGFATRFCAKGRFRSLMETIPVKLVIHPQPGLFGAAAAFALQHLTPADEGQS
ncbi:MAG: glucokinase [Pontixanthobacter sp.]